MPEAVKRAGRLDAALVGEPTNLQFAIAQRGLMMVDLVAHGAQRHAGYAEQEPPNAITALAPTCCASTASSPSECIRCSASRR